MATPLINRMQRDNGSSNPIYADLYNTNKDANQGVSGDIFLNDMFSASPYGTEAGLQQANLDFIPSAPGNADLLSSYNSTPLQSYDSTPLQTQLNRSNRVTMTATPPLQDQSPRGYKQEGSFNGSPDYLDFTDSTLAALFEDPVFDNLTFSSPELTEPTQDWSLQNPNEVDQTTQPAQAPTTKRTRNSSRPDARSACWESPLCPRNNMVGEHPDPSTCDGACGPLLFASLEGKNPADLMPPMPQEEPIDFSSLAIKRPSNKRHNTDSTIGTAAARSIEDDDDDSSPANVKTESSASSPENIPPMPTAKSSRARGRMPHNQVERKYRDSINAQLEALRRVIPSLKQPSETASSRPNCNDNADIEDLPNPASNKPSKAVILSSATTYIRQLERERKRNRDENEKLRERVEALEKLIRCDECEVLGWFRGMKLADGRNNQRAGRPIAAKAS